MKLLLLALLMLPWPCWGQTKDPEFIRDSRGGCYYDSGFLVCASIGDFAAYANFGLSNETRLRISSGSPGVVSTTGSFEAVGSLTCTDVSGSGSWSVTPIDSTDTAVYGLAGGLNNHRFQEDVKAPDGLYTGTSSAAHVGGVLAYSTTQVGNSIGAESDLWSYSVPASTLATDGDSLEMWAGGTFGGTVSIDKRLRVKFGATTIFDSGALTGAQNQEWRVECNLSRTGAATQKAVCSLSTSGVPTGVNYVDYTAPAETLSGAVTLKVTGQGTNASDVKFELGKLAWAPAP